MEKEKIVLYAMTQKGFEVLRALTKLMGPQFIDFVVSSRDNHIANDYFEDIKKYCLSNDISFFQREDQPEPRTEFAIAISWRWIIKLETTKLIVLHDSLLPRFRGFAPLVTGLINGEKELGVTALYASEQYDKGEIIAQQKMDVHYPVTIAAVIKSITSLYVLIAGDLAKKMKANIPLHSRPQDEQQATYSLWLDDIDYFIDWSMSADHIRRFIDAVGYPYKGACSWDGEKICRILEAEVESDVMIENRCPGKLIFINENEPVVVCGSGLLRIKNITDDKGNSLLPLKKFRTRYCNR